MRRRERTTVRTFSQPAVLLWILNYTKLQIWALDTPVLELLGFRDYSTFEDEWYAMRRSWASPAKLYMVPETKNTPSTAPACPKSCALCFALRAPCRVRACDMVKWERLNREIEIHRELEKRPVYVN